MRKPIDQITRHLSDLVAINTTNPPREIDADGALMTLLSHKMPSFDISIHDYGNGSLVFEAKRGQPDVLFNVHLDTVPVAEGWSRNPFTLEDGGDRLIGLGACDIKGAAACLIAIADITDAPMHVVFSTDEEAGQSTCIQEYLKTPPNVTQVIVAEPTQNKAVLEHRGIYSAKMRFEGASGHSSTDAPDSAVHKAIDWAGRVLDVPIAQQNRLNIGRIEGGVKPNMIAASAEILFGFRPAPRTETSEILGAIEAVTRGIEANHTKRFSGPALPSDHDGVSADAQARALAWCKKNDVPLSDPVNFFTEAAFFSAAGLPTIVFGPGDIAQAHTADEWVSKQSLEIVFDQYLKIIEDAQNV